MLVLKILRQSGLVRASAVVLAIRVVNVVVALGISVLLLRTLGLQQFGIYAIYMSTMAILVVPITSGLPTLLVRGTAPAFADGNHDKVRGVTAFALQIFAIYLVLLSITCVILWIISPPWLSVQLLVLIWLHAQFQTLAAMRSALLRSSGHVVRSQFLERFVLPVLTLTLSAIAAILLGDKFSIAHAVSALLLAHFITFVWGGNWVRKYAIAPGPKESVDRKQLFSEGLKMSGSSFLSSLLFNMLVLFIGAMASLEAAGLYRIATAVALPIIYFHEVLMQVLSPTLAKYWHKKQHTALARILHVGVICSCGAVAIGFTLLFFVGKPLLNLTYGPESLAAFSLLMLLSFSHVANAASGFAYELMNMSGHAAEAFHVRLVLIPIAIFLAIPVIYLYGPMGAAFILILYQIGLAVWYGNLTQRITGINPTLFGTLNSRTFRLLKEW